MKKILCIFGAVILMFSFAGCKGNEKSVATNGSTAMEKVIGSLGEVFMEGNPDINFTYNPTGSSAGIAAVVEGTCDIGLSSRPLKDSEKELGLTETVLAYDGIVVIVNPDNKIDDLDIETLAKIFTGEITNWSEIGGENLEIVLIGREAGSGTRDGFEAAVGVAGICKYRQELTSTGDVTTTVASNPNAIGYASLAAIKDTVKMLTVGGVEATEENIKDGKYELHRPFILITKSDEELSESAQEFFDYITSKEAETVIKGAGVIPVN